MKKAFATSESVEPAAAPAEPVEIETDANGGNDEQTAADTSTADTTSSKPAGMYDIDEPTDDEAAPSGDDNGGEAAPAKPAGQKPAQEPAKPDEQPAISSELVARAKKAGLDDAEIGTFDDPKVLTKTLDLLEKRIKPAGGEPAGKPSADNTGVKKPFEKFKIELDPEMYDPDTIKTINGLNEHYANIVNDLGSKLEAATNALQTSRAVDFESRFDARIENLGKDYADVLGDGSGSEMNKDAAEYKNRMKVLDEMEAIALGYQSKGMKMPKESELFDKAIRNVFPEKQTKIATKKISDKIKARAGQLTERPTNRHANAPVNPDAAARNFVKQFLAENDASEGDGDIDF